MPKLLDDYILDETMRYEAHCLKVTLPGEGPLVLQGILAASIFCALLADTEEGDRRGIVLETPAQREDWYLRYERETRREDGGLFSTEVQWLNDSYIEIGFSSARLAQICRNQRLFDLAVGLTDTYLKRITREEVGAHIYDICPWTEPFAQWLLDAAAVETRRQRLLRIDWLDASQVNAIATEITSPQEDPSLTLFFDGLSAEQVMKTYLDWLWTRVQQQAALMPGRKAALAQLRKLVVAHETDYSFLETEIATLEAPNQRLFRQWMSEWSEFVMRQLKPQKEIRFWVTGVPEQTQEQLLDYLRLQEHQPLHYKCLTSAVYALRYLGFIRRKLSEKEMRIWLSERLTNDYTQRTTSSQFSRAWKEMSRYCEAVQDQLELLSDHGVTSFVAPEQE